MLKNIPNKWKYYYTINNTETEIILSIYITWELLYK